MHRMLIVAGVVLAGSLALAAPAAADETDCGRFAPIGAPLPRQDTAELSSRILARPTVQGPDNATLGRTRRGETVTVLEECGRYRRIRAPNGAEGWVGLRTLPRERQMELTAERRQHDQEYDCELKHYTDRTTAAIDACKAALRQKQP